MIDIRPIEIQGKPFIAISVKLPKTNLLTISNENGYIMCGALDVALLNDRLKERNIVAGRAIGVRTIEQLLDAPLESVTVAAERRGIKKGMKGKDALLRM
ncbi:YunC family protein [Fervidibacillus albus]|uniref:DUF1805 domain-containing protein n=1 Tax=Fervidibacillus albus TaxID=2980026 RepID=A0A9E8LUK1_9BACI|nr:DUF1805 domain-containing protein [Fervidibacillus albus]WAA09943.1 DUF1805 domain-containing protein [Fervidibacillus albus]